MRSSDSGEVAGFGSNIAGSDTLSIFLGESKRRYKSNLIAPENRVYPVYGESSNLIGLASRSTTIGGERTSSMTAINRMTTVEGPPREIDSGDGGFEDVWHWMRGGV